MEVGLDLATDATKSMLKELKAARLLHPTLDPWLGQSSQMPTWEQIAEVRDAFLRVNKDLGMYNHLYSSLPPSLPPSYLTS